jgi:lipopolysaccharide export system ATP-binding protein
MLQRVMETAFADAPGLVARGIGKSFGRRAVVRDVTLQLRRGEVVGVLGPNGAGKTTCFYMLTGLIPVDAGSIWLDGADITALPMYRRARLGIAAVATVRYPTRTAQRQVVDALLAEFSLEHLRRAPALTLSGGERRRVEVARAMATNPAFILLDEPFSGIDPIAVGEVRNLVTHLRARNVGVLVTDHNVRETLSIIDRGYIVNEGRVIREGSPTTIVSDATVRSVYLGERFTY